jgi:protein-S-isoprenylcysteine O-methyltransferase Ste14
MQATLFEFRNRYWVILCIFSAAFLAYFIDHVNSGVAMVDWLSRHLGFHATNNSYRLAFALGAFLMVCAAFFRTWGTAYLQANVMRDSRVHTEKLLADGPYRRVRNPLYLANILMAVAVGLMASRTGFLILSLGMTMFVIRLILREEAELLRAQGESYRLYCSAVPRLIPALAPRIPSAGHPTHWGQGFRAEVMYWLQALAVGVFAATLNIKLFWGLFAAAVASSWFYKAPSQQQRKNEATRTAAPDPNPQ